jgi:hypothetical protein
MNLIRNPHAILNAVRHLVPFVDKGTKVYNTVSKGGEK